MYKRQLRERYHNDTYALSKILLSEWHERREQDLSLEEYEQHRQDLLEKHTADYLSLIHI